MSPHIIDLYIYFLYSGKKARRAFERFYNADNSIVWVRKYAYIGTKLHIDYLSKYSKEIRELNKVPFDGIMTPRGVFKC